MRSETIDIGVWMSAKVLAGKLQAQQEDNTEQAWNLFRWPTRFTQEGKHHLFVAVNGVWRCYFTLSREALFSPDDQSVPFTLLFDTYSWIPIHSVPAKRFNGLTYNVPIVNSTGILPPQRSR